MQKTIVKYRRSAIIPAGVRKVFKTLGPGLITGASDDDPSGIATYSQAGAQFGLSTLFTSVLTFPLMAGMQEMCARIGLVTSQGLTATLKQHYPKPFLYVMLLFSFPAITLNIGANIQAIGAVCHMIIPAVPVAVFCTGATFLLMVVIIRYPYQKIAVILKWLCASLLLYIIVPFMVDQDWKKVAGDAIIPVIHYDKNFLSIIVAILGTTISPYLFYWQATMEAEERLHNNILVIDKQILHNMRTDVGTGMFFSNVVMFFIILTTGTVLYQAGIRQIDTVDQAAKALEPLAGKLTYIVFASGILGTGLLAIPVLTGAQSYMLAETLGWTEGLDKKFTQAKPFYISIVISLTAGLLLQFSGISPFRALLYTAIVYGLTAPVLIAIVLHIGNNKKIMKENTNTWFANLLGIITLVIMTAAAIALIWSLL